MPHAGRACSDSISSSRSLMLESSCFSAILCRSKSICAGAKPSAPPRGMPLHQWRDRTPVTSQAASYLPT